MSWLIHKVCLRFVIGFAQWWTKFWMNRALVQVQDLWLTMNSVMVSLHAVRMILLKGEDSGGMINRDIPLYISALNWVYAKEDKRFHKDKLVRHRVDNEYWDTVIHRILNDSYIVVITDELEDGFLRNLCVAEGIAMSICFKIDLKPESGPTKILYAALDYDNVVDHSTPEFQNELTHSITQIRNVGSGLI